MQQGAGGATASSGALKACGPEGLIDDGEDGNNQNNPEGGRGGYWYTFVDKVGTTVTPTAGEQGGTFTMSPGGANGSKFAANFKGQIGHGAITFAGMGMNFVDPKGPYDASQYVGVTFFGKKGSGSTGKVRMKVPDQNTDGDAKVCSECFNDFGTDMQFSDDWKRYTFLFDRMKQEEGWGAPRPKRIDVKQLYGVQYQVKQAGAAYDIWIDDLAFVCQ